jgi:protease-4
MREFFRSFFASLLAIVVSGVLFLFLIVGLVATLAKSVTEKENKTISGDVLVIDITKKIHEQGETNPFAAFSESAAYRAGLYDMIKALAEAKFDDDIKGVYLKLGSSPNGWATLQELREALVDFRKSGKFVYSYGENITQGAYFVATASDSIFVNPAGSVELKGMATTLAFFKGTLDKLEIEPEIFYAGKFKSATEPFRAEKMSEPNRIQVKAFQDGMWQEFLKAASDYMKMPPDSVNQLAQNGTIQFPSDAAKAGMVAGLRYKDEIEQLVAKKTGRGAGESIKTISINDYADLVRSSGAGAQERIAILFAEGDIVDGEQNDSWQIASVTLSEEIKKLRKNEKVKAVVLRVNSPGGSALASEVILRELLLLKQKKPLVVSMGNYAASGGYYISSHADSIFALPNTITGSIGVFGMLFNIDRLMKNKMGVTFDDVKNAPYADFPTTTRPLTVAEAALMQRSIDTIYAQFKKHVVSGRKLDAAMVDSIAQGRVWTGVDAVKNGLADRLGGLEEAIVSAASLAKVKSYKVVTYPEPVDKLSNLMKRLDEGSQSKAAIKAALTEEAAPMVEWYNKLKSLKDMNGRAMMAMPFVLNVN